MERGGVPLGIVQIAFPVLIQVDTLELITPRACTRGKVIGSVVVVVVDTKIA